MAELIGSELLDQIAVEMLKASESADLRAEALCVVWKNWLPIRCTLLRERYHDDKSTAQIAAEQKCSVSAVQKTLKRVYKALHDCIESVLVAKEAKVMNDHDAAQDELIELATALSDGDFTPEQAGRLARAVDRTWRSAAGLRANTAFTVAVGAGSRGLCGKDMTEAESRGMAAGRCRRGRRVHATR